MIEIFIHRAEILSPTGNGAELRKQQKEMQLQIKSDRAPGGPGMFRGIFSTGILYGFLDPEDGLVRCPRCMWEVHGGRCENPQCGVRVRVHGEEEDFSDEDESGDSTEAGSEPETDNGIDIDAPGRWPESIVGEDEEWEDDDGSEDVDDVTNRQRQRGFANPFYNIPALQERVAHRRRQRELSMHTSEEEDEDSDGTVGSLADFIDDDSPQTRRRIPGRNGPWALSSSPAEASSPVRPVAAARRQNARPIIIDDDDDDEEDNQSSFSEASSRPAGGTRRSNRYQNSRHVSLSSDCDDDEMESNGYQALLGSQTDHTATEDEDDGFSSPPIRPMGARRNMIARPGSVFSVPEEDDEDGFGDADESEDQDGDITMGESDQRRNVGSAQPTRRNVGSAQPTRRNAGSSRNQPIELDSASESEVALSPRRRRRANGQASARHNNNYYSNHQRSTSGGGSRNRTRMSSMELDPSILGLLAQHGQQLRDTQYNALGRNSSASPARSLTPVQRTGSGRRSSNGSRGSTPLSPLRGVLGSPAPFSPLQSPQQTTPQRQLPSVIPATQSPAQITPGTNNPWTQRGYTLSPRLGHGPGASIFSQLQHPRRTASPFSTGARVRSRNSTRQLRGGSESRNSHRGNSTPTSPPQSFVGGTSNAGLQGRPQIQQLQQHHQLQQQQLQQIPQQQPSPQQLGQRQSISPQQIGQRPGGSPQQAGGARPGTSPRRLTVEDIRARGEQLRQQQLRMIHGGGTLRTPGETNSSSGSPVGGGENRTTPPANGVGGVDIRRGNRLGALIGGGPADQRGGGPMLVIGSDDGTPQYGG
jgi:hypothetical protein